MWIVSAVISVSVVLWMATTWWIGLLFCLTSSSGVRALVRHRRA
jgi:hypothetical protein